MDSLNDAHEKYYVMTALFYCSNSVLGFGRKTTRASTMPFKVKDNRSLSLKKPPDTVRKFDKIFRNFVRLL